METSKDLPVPTPSSGFSKINYEELSYLPPPDPFYVQEGLKEKMIRKTKENPFVPLGVIFTTVVLGIGLSTLKTGNNRRGQIMMRLRVGGQAFAIFALLGGVYFKAKTDKHKEDH